MAKQVLFFNGYDVVATPCRGRGRELRPLLKSEIAQIYREFRSRTGFSIWIPKWIQFDTEGFWFAGDEDTTKWEAQSN